jgi:hypothetical protein
VAIEDRLKRLEGDSPDLCAERPCVRLYTTEVIRYPDGTRERIDEGPPPKCAACPYREGGGPMRHLEVVKRY